MGQTDPTEIWELFPGYTGRLAFDIGAHHGEVADILACNFERVIACEPLPQAFERLKLRALPNVTAVDIAVTEYDGTVELQVGESPFPMLVTGNTLSWNPTSSLTLQATTLDTMRHVFGDPDFIKIDTEGHEVAVLKGGQELLKACRPRLLIEVHSEPNLAECLALLPGYACEVIRHPHYEVGSYLYLNHCFVRAE